MTTHEDLQAQQLQKHLLRHEAELRDREGEVEAQRLELFFPSHSMEENSVVQQHWVLVRPQGIA